ncbi:hypothetical protein [Streptomyces sp. NPDC052107]|uniref:hypothetical protein n=1 Tax=Streptomyces sp. NPDC052107 TaxID=3155632 RepID=UPI00342E84AB
MLGEQWSRLRRWVVSSPGRRVLTRAIQEDLGFFDLLPSDAVGVDGARRRALLFASLRLRGTEAVAMRRIRMNAIVFLLPFTIAAFVTRIRNAAADYVPPPPTPPGAQPPAVIDSPTALIFGMTTAVICNVVVARARRLPVVSYSRGRRLAVASALPGFSAATVQIPFSLITPHTAWWHYWVGYYYVTGVLLITLAAVVLFEQPLPRRIAGRCRPTDRLLIQTLATAAEIHARTRRRLTPTRCRSLCRDLEHLAYMAERDLTLPYRAPHHIRRALRPDALRVAAVYRAHQMPLTLVDHPHDADPLVASLLAAADALAAGERAALLDNAPEQVAQRRLVRRVVSRAWPAVALIASGVLLPLIPAVAQQPALASSLRWTLVVAGALTFVAGSDVATRVASPLDKALPWR